MKLLKTKIVLSTGQAFVIYHNMPEGELESLTKQWLAEPETSKNPKALVRKLNDDGWVAYTEKQYKRHGHRAIKPFIRNDKY